jgi:hypothetical protein
MQPEEWETLADSIAARISARISTLETDLRERAGSLSFKQFWSTVRALNDEIRHAPAIKLDDKLAAQRRINGLCASAKDLQRALRDEQDARVAEINDSLDLAAGSLSAASTLQQIQDVRSYLNALRPRLAGGETRLPRSAQQAVWKRWQDLNAAAWERLNEMWSENEAALRSILDDAQERLTANDPRGAREHIRTFQSRSGSEECSHVARKALRARANDLWKEAEQVAHRKRAAYLTWVDKRVHQWRDERGRAARAREQIAREISGLEAEIRDARTDVAAALLRGRLAERQKTLRSLEATERELARQIEDAETALSSS